MFNVKISVIQMIVTAFFCLTGAIFQAQAAVTIDRRSAGGGADNVGLASISWSHTIGGGAARALFVGVSTSTTTLPVSLPANRVAGVTYGNTAMTRVGTIVSANSLNAAEIFVLVNPPTGTANIVATFSLTVAAIPVVFVNQASGNSVSFFGVSQTMPTGTFTSAAGNSTAPTLNVAGNVAGDFVFDTLAISPTGIFAGAGANQTVCTDESDETTCTRGRRFFNTAYDIGAASTEPGATANVTMSWTITGDSWALGAVTIRQSASPTAAAVTLAGRVLASADGRGVARAVVTLTGADGATRTATTNAFGYYRFAEVGAGETYVIQVFSKRHTFAPQIVSFNEENADLNFVAQP